MASKRDARGGFTLLELGISAGILLFLLIVVGQVVLAGSRAFRSGSASDSVMMRTRRGVDRIADELGMAGIDSLTPVPIPPLGSSTIDLRTPTGLAGGVMQFGNLTRILLRADPSDAFNGGDDDGDGLIDEEVVELTKDVGLPSQRSVVLVENVSRLLEGEIQNGLDDNGNGLIDEAGLSFVLQGERLTVRLTTGGFDADRRPITHTVETAVKIRN